MTLKNRRKNYCYFNLYKYSIWHKYEFLVVHVLTWNRRYIYKKRKIGRYQLVLLVLVSGWDLKLDDCGSCTQLPPCTYIHMYSELLISDREKAVWLVLAANARHVVYSFCFFFALESYTCRWMRRKKKKKKNQPPSVFACLNDFETKNKIFLDVINSKGFSFLFHW